MDYVSEKTVGGLWRGVRRAALALGLTAAGFSEKA